MNRKVIDVSYHNGTIDWEKVKADGVEGAILRCGYGMDIASQDDKQFKRNADECTRLGIPFGVYLYSYADSIEKAKSEAQHALRLVSGYNLLYPIYYDLEESGTESGAVERARVFCEAIESARYWAGIYCNKHWWDNYLNALGDQYTKWIARYNSTLGMSGVDMWQYTSDGSVSGISGRVDMNECYRDFPAEIGGSGSSQTQPSKPAESMKIEVDGKWGTKSTYLFQYVLDLPIKDGEVSNQKKKFKQPGCYTGWEWEENPTGHSDLIEALQEMVNDSGCYDHALKVDGYLGPDTIKGLQTYFGTPVDGEISKVSKLVEKMQEWANEKVA